MRSSAPSRPEPPGRDRLRGAPKTGYIVDLDDYVYGKLRASYVVPLQRPIVLSGIGSVVSPFNLSTYENTVTLGVTLTSDLLAKKD